MKHHCKNRETSASDWNLSNRKRGSRPVSRVLSRTVIHLDVRHRTSQATYPGTDADHIVRKANVPLFGLAPGGVYPAVECCHRRGALLPHHFNLTGTRKRALRRYIFCCTGRRLTPPRCYLAPCPVEPGLSSLPQRIARLSSQLPTPYIKCSTRKTS